MEVCTFSTHAWKKDLRCVSFQEAGHKPALSVEVSLSKVMEESQFWVPSSLFSLFMSCSEIDHLSSPMMQPLAPTSGFVASRMDKQKVMLEGQPEASTSSVWCCPSAKKHWACSGRNTWSTALPWPPRHFGVTFKV